MPVRARPGRAESTKSSASGDVVARRARAPLTQRVADVAAGEQPAVRASTGCRRGKDARHQRLVLGLLVDLGARPRAARRRGRSGAATSSTAVPRGTRRRTTASPPSSSRPLEHVGVGAVVVRLGRGSVTAAPRLPRRSSLDRALGEPGDDEPLQEREEEHHRDRGEQHAGGERRPTAPRTACR